MKISGQNFQWINQVKVSNENFQWKIRVEIFSEYFNCKISSDNFEGKIQVKISSENFEETEWNKSGANLKCKLRIQNSNNFPCSVNIKSFTKFTWNSRNKIRTKNVPEN